MYDIKKNPKEFLGVFGIDVLMTDFLKIEPSFSKIKNKLFSKSTKCVSIQLNYCQLEALRSF